MIESGQILGFIKKKMTFSHPFRRVFVAQKQRSDKFYQEWVPIFSEKSTNFNLFGMNLLPLL